MLSDFFDGLFGALLMLALLPLTLGALLAITGKNIGISVLISALSLFPGGGAYLVAPATSYARMFSAPVHRMLTPGPVKTWERKIRDPMGVSGR